VKLETEETGNIKIHRLNKMETKREGGREIVLPWIKEELRCVVVVVVVSFLWFPPFSFCFIFFGEILGIRRKCRSHDILGLNGPVMSFFLLFCFERFNSEVNHSFIYKPGEINQTETEELKPNRTESNGW